MKLKLAPIILICILFCSCNSKNDYVPSNNFKSSKIIVSGNLPEKVAFKGMSSNNCCAYIGLIYYDKNQKTYGKAIFDDYNINKSKFSISSGYENTCNIPTDKILSTSELAELEKQMPENKFLINADKPLIVFENYSVSPAVPSKMPNRFVAYANLNNKQVIDKIRAFGKPEGNDYVALIGFLCDRNGDLTFETACNSYKTDKNIPAGILKYIIPMPKSDNPNNVLISTDNLLVIYCKFISHNESSSPLLQIHTFDTFKQ